MAILTDRNLRLLNEDLDLLNKKFYLKEKKILKIKINIKMGLK
jgi:hypothetical protein